MRASAYRDAELGETVLALQTELRPTNYSNVLKPGFYRLKLLVAGANCKPTSWIVELALTGKWFDDKERMFQEGVIIKVFPESSGRKGDKDVRFLNSAQVPEKGVTK